MPRGAEPQPGDYAKAVASAIRETMAVRGVSGRQLAEAIGVSERYVRVRVNQEASFTLTDVEKIAEVLKFEAAEFLGSVEVEVSPAVDNVTPIGRRDYQALSAEQLREIQHAAYRRRKDETESH